MINIKKASPLVSLALAGTLLAGCSGEPKEYRNITVGEIAPDCVPIGIYPVVEIGGAVCPLSSTSYIWDYNEDGEADAVGFAGSTFFIAEGYHGRERDKISKDCVIMSDGVREQLTDYMQEGKRLGVLLTNLQAGHLNENERNKK